MQIQLYTNNDQITTCKTSTFWRDWNGFEDISKKLFKPSHVGRREGKIIGGTPVCYCLFVFIGLTQTALPLTPSPSLTRGDGEGYNICVSPVLLPTIHTMLLHLPALLTPEEVRFARAALEQAVWHDGRATAGHLAVQVKANQQLPLDNALAAQLGDVILDKLGASSLFISAALPLKVLPPRFNRYEGGGTYGNHIDNAIFTMQGTGERVRTDVSTTVFFSHPDEYEGGELMIDDTYGQHSVKLAAGDAIVYPGSSLHRVNPVTRGVRYASFFWTHSMVASAEKRRLLFDLDQQIQQLTQLHPQEPTLAALSGTYHNLLRMWAQA